MLRGKRTLIALLVLLALLATATITARWLLRPDNLARVITSWVERELGAQLTLADAPGVRLVPQLQLSLEGARLERGGTLLASAEELRVALPWSTLWAGGITIESLSIRRPVIAWPQLTILLGELSDEERPAQVARLPDIGIGIRIEEGTLLSGDGDADWRIDRISMVTTPLHDGEVFHLDAGARFRGAQSRTLSFTLRATPAAAADRLDIQDLAARIVVSPVGSPLSEGQAIELGGSLSLTASGLAAMTLNGAIQGWPDWLPAGAGFAPDISIEVAATLEPTDPMLTVSLEQADRSLTATVDTRDLGAAADRIARPLAALGVLRSEWSVSSIGIGDFQVEGARLRIGATHDAEAMGPPYPPDAAAENTGGD